MAIRDRFRRAMRKSGSSSSSDTISQTESNTTTTTANTSETSSVHKSTSSKLARTLAFGRRSDEAKEAKRNKKNKKIHPSQRPLTLQNLKHQEMLSTFTMTFGASDPDQIESLSFIGVSPCCTRAPSLDMDRSDLDLSPMDSPSPAYSVRD